MSAMCHDCGTYIDEDVETSCPSCKSGIKREIKESEEQINVLSSKIEKLRVEKEIRDEYIAAISKMSKE